MDRDRNAPDRGKTCADPAPGADAMQALRDLRQQIGENRPQERRATNRELLEAVRNAPTAAERDRAADALRRQIKSLCAAIIDRQNSALTAQEVEDLTQEVLLRLLQSRSVETVDPTPAYLHRIATNVLIDHLRFLKRRGLTAPTAGPESEAEMARLADPRPSVEEEALGRIRTRELRAALVRLLRPLEADVLWLRAEGASHLDIAAELGIQEANARKHLQRGINRLKRMAVVGELGLAAADCPR